MSKTEGSALLEEEAEDLPHILVVDDDARLRSLLQRYLKQNGFRVTTAGDATQAQARMAGLEFDLLVLDVMMPGISGIELAKILRGKASPVPILMLTARAEAGDRIAGLETGVDDYLTKPYEPRELVLRIRSILRRAQPATKKTELRMGPFRFSPDRGELTREGKPVRLTSSEVTLLKILAGSIGKPLSRLELTELTGAGLERSVDVQVNRLRRKIEADPKMPIYLQTVRGVGYVLVPD
ncbi:MAG TPA: response regulator [Alphaproteobacteria bacterium]|nr:response regulator [Alphaproteobacteria bacterium]